MIARLSGIVGELGEDFAVIDLLLDLQGPAAGAAKQPGGAGAQGQREKLRAELEGLRLKELRARAKKAGVDEDVLEEMEERMQERPRRRRAEMAAATRRAA